MRVELAVDALRLQLVLQHVKLTAVIERLVLIQRLFGYGVHSPRFVVECLVESFHQIRVFSHELFEFRKGKQLVLLELVYVFDVFLDQQVEVGVDLYLLAVDGHLKGDPVAS